MKDPLKKMEGPFNVMFEAQSNTCLTTISLEIIQGLL